MKKMEKKPRKLPKNSGEKLGKMEKKKGNKLADDVTWRRRGCARGCWPGGAGSHRRDAARPGPSGGSRRRRRKWRRRRRRRRRRPCGRRDAGTGRRRSAAPSRPRPPAHPQTIRSLPCLLPSFTGFYLRTLDFT